MKISLITITHTGAYSLVQAARDAGWDVVAPQGIHINEKIKKLSSQKAYDCDLLWAHWAWAGLLPNWVFKSRSVVTVLRDPMECAISSHIRGHAKKCPQHARQWLNLYYNRYDVDDFISFADIDKSHFGLPRLQRLNATSDDDRIKQIYASKGLSGIRGVMEPYIQCLRVVRPEIFDVFSIGGLTHLLRGGMFDPSSTKVPFRNGVV